jgi:uncharacterized membrane protein
MNLFKKNYFLFTTVLFSIFAITPLLRPDFFVSNELLGPVYRLAELDVSIKDGDLFPWWSPDLFGGLGGPFFNFYAPLSYYVAELFHLMGLGYVKSIKATYAASFIISGIFMYLFAANRMNKNGAFVASVFYMYAPYRFMSVYSRGAFTEAFTFIFLPLILLSFHKIAEEQKINRYFALASLSLAGLIFCHNIIALFFTGFLVVYLLFLLYEFPSSKIKLFSAIIFGLCLSSFYWLPALMEKKYVEVDRVLVFDFHGHFIKLNQIIPPLSDLLTRSNNTNNLAAQIGIVHLIFTILAVIYIRNRHTLFLSSLFIGTLFFMSSLSTIFWENLPLVHYAQFPTFRLFPLIVLLTSLLTGFFVSNIFKNEGKKEYLRVVIISLLVVFSSFNHIGSEGRIIYDDKDFTSEHIRELNTGLTYIDEYLPKDVVRFSNLEIKNKVEVSQGNAKVGPITEKSTLIEFETEGGESLLRIYTYHYPGWAAYVDGGKAVLQKDDYGLINLKISEGRHKVKLKFEDTPIRRWANFLSLFSFIALILLMARAHKWS